ncbi:LOW QUALITY PROTEIN: probable disease resistance protein RPP1 [Arabidopsis lyrata subsp. lyrata]|uniref:LOW QUALITY PROTEIN: probable disease resistance protein RPP1 n=1 Tax=Arabidopsis lyrata subsp. lyrata TaxID=81972 RepID=UPI000A29AE2E|nr:LOW QUALITY PROTEIN: probable disease resistance protein RPP1 [Arabidopsis lyrata subsp. lyrata]|eukprot:XP_020875315.1 LOW QUALITY PROTEIN: probable disease resistance protein RPP1 [Arabidopsis lyrata subsp. lyrata]
MDSSSSFILTTVAAAISFFTLLRKLRCHQEDDKENNTSSSTSLSPSSLSPSSLQSSLDRIWTHHVFPSFRGEDVRRDFLSHIQMEFQRMGITPFIDNEIKRGQSIGPELIRAIRESKIAIILLSRNYASSSWCLDELAEIMKCREELGQTVLAVFYKVDPSDVKKLTGDFGKVFKKTCAGKTKEHVGRWRQALANVATIAGYHSTNWDNEAAMIKKIATDISNMLNNSASSSDFDGLVGMREHLEKMEPLLCLDSDEVRLIGIWGPSGIGKTTIARVIYNKLSGSFQLSVFMESIEAKYTRPCSDDYSAKLQLQQQFMSQITNQSDMKISHLGVVQDRLKDKKVLVVLDGVDQSMQLDAMAKETWWFGPGSRIIITTQDRKLFRAHGINHIYKVDFPSTEEALQILCKYAFGQNSPTHGFEELAWEVTQLAGELPLGLRVIGSYFRGMSKMEWMKALPRLRNSLDANILSILKFSYDALDDEDKYLFLHIACFFNHEEIEKVEDYLAETFLDVSHRLNVLAEKSLISLNRGYINMHDLLVKLGRDIVRKQSIREPGQRLFLVDAREICEVLNLDANGSRSLMGINFNFGEDRIKEKLHISERAFQGMSNLQFLRVKGNNNTIHLPHGLEYISRKLRLLHWTYFPMTCLPPIFNTEFLVELDMSYSKLEKLWEGIKPLPNLKRMDLSSSLLLKELPDLIGNLINLKELDLSSLSCLVELPSSIGNLINLKELDLSSLSCLVELPSSIGNLINLKELDLSSLSCLVELPFSIGNATNLEVLNLRQCSSLVKLPFSIGNLQKLQTLTLRGCSKLEDLPANIKLGSLGELDLTDCLLLKRFPEISTNVEFLRLDGTAIEEVPSSIKSWSRLNEVDMSYSENLKNFPHAFDIITELHMTNTEIQEFPPWVKKFSRLTVLILKGCKKLVSLPQIPDSITYIYAEDCESLERLDCSFHNPNICLKFAKCFKLNQEARDLIIQTPTSNYAVLPGREVPAYFTHQSTTGGSLTIKLNEKPLPTSMRFKACILLVHKGDNEARDDKNWMDENVYIVSCNESTHYLYPVLAEHVYVFEVEADVTSSELVFEFKISSKNWKIKECGVFQLSELP